MGRDGIEPSPGQVLQGWELPLSSKNLFDFGCFKKKQQDPAPGGGSPAVGEVIALGWTSAVECWFSSRFPIPSPFCLLGAEGPRAGAALLGVSRGSRSPRNSELSDPCHDSPTRRL